MVLVRLLLSKAVSLLLRLLLLNEWKSHNKVKSISG